MYIIQGDNGWKHQVVNIIVGLLMAEKLAGNFEGFNSFTEWSTRLCLVSTRLCVVKADSILYKCLYQKGKWKGIFPFWQNRSKNFLKLGIFLFIFLFYVFFVCVYLVHNLWYLWGIFCFYFFFFTNVQNADWRGERG